MPKNEIELPLYSFSLYLLINIASYHYRTLGTPNETTWPGVEQLKEFKKDFPKWKTQNLHTIVPQLEEEGVDLLEVISNYTT